MNNKVTLRYLKEANIGLREQSSNKKQKNDELISYQSGNETIIQPKYLKDSSAFGTIINIVVGIVIGVAITAFLVVPGVKSTAQQEAKQEVLEANNTISSKNQTIASLEDQIDELAGKITNMQLAGDDVTSQVNSYDQLLQAYISYEKEEIDAAGVALGMVDEAHLSETAMQVYNTINGKVNEQYLTILYKDGYDAYSRQDYPAAIENLKRAVELDVSYQNGNALYYLAQAYRKNNDLESAKPYYARFLELYPNTERAATAARYAE